MGLLGGAVVPRSGLKPHLFAFGSMWSGTQSLCHLSEGVGWMIVHETVDGPLAVGRWGLIWEKIYRHPALIRGHAAPGSGIEVGLVPSEAVEAGLYCAGPLWVFKAELMERAPRDTPGEELCRGYVRGWIRALVHSCGSGDITV